ncbi:MAG: NUDIX hydrolase [Candidatus Kapaibacteriota bacterium]
MVDFVSNTVQVHIAAYNEQIKCFKYLALKRSSKNPIYPGIWQAITGTIENDETAIECAIREIKEETGLTPKQIWTIPYVGVFFDPYKNAINAVPVFGALVDFVEQIKISSEHEGYGWFDLSEFISIVPLPSHKLGAEYFWEYILRHSEQKMFKYNK